MDLETLLSKPIGELTIDEVRFLQANTKNFIDVKAVFDSNYSTLTVEDYTSLVITEETITVNSDHQNAIPIDKAFKKFLIQSLLDATDARILEHEQREVDLANRLIELNS